MGENSSTSPICGSHFPWTSGLAPVGPASSAWESAGCEHAVGSTESGLVLQHSLGSAPVPRMVRQRAATEGEAWPHMRDCRV